MPSNNPPINIEELLVRKDICLITRQISDTTHNLTTSTIPLPKDHLVVDNERRIIKIGDGVHTWSSTKNHTHDDQYSPIVHGHYFGYGEKWFRSCPRLWSKKDLINHPELIPCDGRFIDPEVAVFLEDIYSGTTIGTIVTENNNTGSNYLVSAYVTGNESPDAYSYKVFQNTENLIVLDPTDQLILTNPITSSTQEVVFTWEFTHDVMKPTEYSIISSIGNTPSSIVIGPKSWILEGCQEDSTEWEVLHSASTSSVWTSSMQRDFSLDGDVTNTYYQKFRLRVLEWFNSVDNTIPFPVNVGLRRLYITGKFFNKFKMPNIPSPSSEFVYVVPIKDLEVGMKHEEVGDIGYTSAYTRTLPANRLPLDGRALNINENPHLYGVCGQKYAPHIQSTSHDILNPTTLPLMLDIEFDSPKILGYIKITPDANVYPLYFTLAVYVNGTWSTIDTGTYTEVPSNHIYYFTPTDIASTRYRLYIHTWSSTPISDTLHMTIDWFGSDPGKFHIPRIVPDSTSNILPYIVTQVRTEDINASIVLELQSMLVEAQRQIVTLTNRLVNAEIQIQNLIANP